MPEVVASISHWPPWKLKFRCHMLHTQDWWPWLMVLGSILMVNVESSCPWIPLYIVIYQRDVLLADLKITQVLPAWKASPFTEVAEMHSVWVTVAFPEQWMQGSDACSTCWVLCWCCVSMIRHLKCFFSGVLFKNSFPQSNVLFYLPSTFPPFF